MRRLRLLVCLLTLVAASASADAGRVHGANDQPASLQPAAPDRVNGYAIDSLPGVVAAAGRSFDAADRTSEIGHLEFAVFAFEDAETAQAALPRFLESLPAFLREDLARIEAPLLGNESAAWGVTIPAGGYSVMLVRDDNYVHAMSAATNSGYPVDALASTVEQFVGARPAATPVATSPTATPALSASGPYEQRPLRTGGLWDMLPVYDDLPGDFVLYNEEYWPR